MMTLNEIMNLSGSDKGDSIGAKHNYTPIYESYFEKHRSSKITFMEVGIDFGQSLKGWYQYFENGKIFMVDISNFSHLNNDRVTCIQANQSNHEDMRRAGQIAGSIDFFIDDGGHCMDHQQITFGEIFPFIKPGGLFFIEDVVTSNWFHQNHCYNQPLRINDDRSNTTIRIFKDFQHTGNFESEFLSDEKNLELTSMIDEVIIYDDHNTPVPLDSNLENQILSGGVILIRKK